MAFWVALPFWLLGVGLSVYGLFRHRYSTYSLGVTIIGLQGATALYERWLRNDNPPDGLSRFIIILKAFGLVFIGLLLAYVLSWKLSGDWFPELKTPR